MAPPQEAGVRRPCWDIARGDDGLHHSSFEQLAIRLGVAFWFAVGAGSISYGAAALLLGARRTPDRSMRKFVRMLGLAIICMVLFFTVWIPFAPFSLTVQDLGT